MTEPVIGTQHSQNRSPSRETVVIGAVAAAAGLYFILVSFGVAPEPSNRAAGAPMWLVFCCGLPFLLGGLSVMIRGITGTPDSQPELSPTTPRWAHALYHLIGIAIGVSFASIGTWIALGAGPRQFALSMPFFHAASVGKIIGRSAFGFGALIVWAYVIALIVRSARKLFAPGKS